jgi:hypothetical protein
MALSTRDYLLEQNGTLRRVPHRVVESMIGGDDAMPQFAGETLRAVTVILENDGGKPSRILDAQGSYWAFDSDGKISRSLSKAAFEFMDVAFNEPDRSSKVVSLTPEIKRRDVKARHRWDVTKDILDRISADIWPGIAGQAAEVTSITGKLPKRPPLTLEARRILPDIAARLSLIETDLRMLSEPALKGLAFEARRTAEYGEDNPALWKGLAEACDRQREIQRRRRLGTGIWFAVLEVFHHVSEIESRSVFLAHEKCEGKEHAVDAARKLLVMHADKFSDDYSIEVNVYPDLEWKPMEE